MHQIWEAYWEDSGYRGKWLYDGIAVCYRQFIIRPALNYFVFRYFPSRVCVLHAGGGSGQVDVQISDEGVSDVDRNIQVVDGAGSGHFDEVEVWCRRITDVVDGHTGRVARGGTDKSKQFDIRIGELVTIIRWAADGEGGIATFTVEAAKLDQVVLSGDRVEMHISPMGRVEGDGGFSQSIKDKGDVVEA